MAWLYKYLYLEHLFLYNEKTRSQKMKMSVVLQKGFVPLFCLLECLLQKTLVARKQGTWQRRRRDGFRGEWNFRQKTKRFFKSNLLSAQNFYH